MLNNEKIISQPKKKRKKKQHRMNTRVIYNF